MCEQGHGLVSEILWGWGQGRSLAVLVHVSGSQGEAQPAKHPLHMQLERIHTSPQNEVIGVCLRTVHCFQRVQASGSKVSVMTT